MAEKRELILKLGQKITDRIGHKVTVDDPEYWGLACIVTDEMAEVALKMKVRKPMTFPQLLKATGKEEKELEKLLEEMSIVGLLEYNWENPQKEKQYILPMFVPGSAEFTNMNRKQLEEHPELGRFFERMSRLPLEKVTPMVPPGGAGIGMHVIPVEKAIEMENQSIDIEHISHWLKKYEGKYAASPCSCRLSRQTYEEGCADDPEDWCIAVGDMADYVVETQKGGRYITYEEVLDILKKAEDNGFVHQITNIDGKNKIFAICNCNVNVCYALRTSQLFNTPNMSRSAYVAHVKTENCVACGRCVEYCPAGAVKLGQKLCTKDGPIEYPKHELPDAVKWGPEKWDEDYRDNNRINCYDTGTAPCKTACPAHIAVQGYLKKAAQGKYREALALIKKENPFPAVCGHICNRRCEDACTRGTIDQAVAIDEVKKFIAKQDLTAENRYIPPIIPPTTGRLFEEKIAIIGGGPAGLSCAFYLAEKGYKPTVFEKNEKPGGMLVYGIPSFKLEKDVVEAEIDVMRQMGVEIKCGIEVGKDITLEELRKQGYKAFYLAIGCQGGRKANIQGEDAEGVMTAVDFLRTVGDNQNYPVEGRTVVVGGGNVAIDVARTASRCGASEVSMFCLESREIMPASEEEITEAQEEGITLNCGWGPKEILTENGKVKGIVFKKCLSVFDENKRFAPKFDEAVTMTVPCERVFLSIGQSIVWGNLLEGSKVELGRGNGAVADKVTYQTAEPDIFVGGDVYTGPKFAIDAIAAGKEGAISIHRFVQPHSSLTIGRNRRQFIELDKSNIQVEEYDNSSRQIPGVRKDIDVHKSFRDAKETFTEEQVRKETARCLGCGASVVDENKCIGCGVCTTKCEFDAIHLYREHPECSTMHKSEDKMKVILPYAFKREMKIRFGKKEK
ncbi:FAD-dependent oxidoreductase [Lachnospiraceae bacterium AM25-11LB]|jgi:NADPH-dependent glutamate synthase beta subunit-like oxidoreductase|uniref:FAD-dependent oxidoreductase n=1 Tax=Blautia hansenii TaxID=1322 RepID=UPI000E3F3479|nr:FAD-dependent oxidoreductase [Lachnospiraceae bacterium AM25-22]RGD07757.1 FAD-dependent oxidoreductase [Lachnospiraceae bacterium AM25-11LB]RJW10604.1 FAD-dependent oxidoreductase [Lachnospiraceae bacterium AM25-40]RJW15092.1 FAD-dependent oxidoreductase [Lachnospiraceae bacterium AM25-39]